MRLEAMLSGDVPRRIETERLLLRVPKPGDGATIHQAIMESLDHLKPWMPWAHEPLSPEAIEINAQNAAMAFNEHQYFRYQIYLKVGGRMVGTCELHSIDWSVPRMEIGYWARVGFTGKGYITEAVQALTNLALNTLGAVRVEIHCNAKNRRSAAVAERAGYVLEACLHHYERDVGNALRDTLIYVRFPLDDKAGL